MKLGKSESTRAEYRAPDPACNPYLAFAVILAAGLKGIEKGYELPPEADAEPLLAQSRRAQPGRHPAAAADARRGRRRHGAIRARRRETLGEHVFEWFIRNKRSEWEQYCREVTPYELNRYLPAL